PGLPTFVPSFEPPLRIRVLPPARELDALARAAQSGGAHEKILYGVALQRLDRPVSAKRQFAKAAREAPVDPEARVAAAVGRFDKANPSAAFSRLGPLVRVFPRSQTVRFHLGLLLLWIGQVDKARDELQQARGEAAKNPLESGREAGSLSTEEIAVALGELELDAAQMDEFYNALEELHIEVVENGAEEQDAAAAAETREVSTDSLQLFLKDIGKVDLLTAAQE